MGKQPEGRPGWLLQGNQAEQPGVRGAASAGCGDQAGAWEGRHMHRDLRNAKLKMEKEKNSLAQLSPLRVGSAGDLGSGGAGSPGETQSLQLPTCWSRTSATLAPSFSQGQVHSCLPSLPPGYHPQSIFCVY